jgi:hypothetical protein
MLMVERSQGGNAWAIKERPEKSHQAKFARYEVYWRRFNPWVKRRSIVSQFEWW